MEISGATTNRIVLDCTVLTKTIGYDIRVGLYLLLAELFFIKINIKTGQCKKLRGKFINCYLCLQIHSLWS